VLTARRVLAGAAGVCLLGLSSATTATAPAAGAPSLHDLVGQRLLVRMEGPWPSADFLARIRRGEISGVILFKNNVGPRGLKALVSALQSAAKAGDRPPLLLATDQEGGGVKRLPGPPTLAPSQMTTAAIAEAQGTATGRSLAAYGINTNLAPVLDVPSVRGAFIASRTFGKDAHTVSTRGVAFARGLVAGGVVATAKHFPGLGGATTNTDSSPSVVKLSKTRLLQDLQPFRSAIAAKVPLIMFSTAIYPNLGSKLPAACSPAIVRLLRTTLGYEGPTVSDDLGTHGVTDVIPLERAVVSAAAAGVDMLYVSGASGTDADTASKRAFTTLLAAARDGRLSQKQLLASDARIAQLKSTLR
jgi:beta-N-acetylhexosaminidase